MAKQAYLGHKIRRLRKEAGVTQAKLAERLNISASYLNLLERNHRPLTVPLLLQLADMFDLDLKTFAEDDEAQLVAGLREALSDGIFRDSGVKDADIRELLANVPSMGRAVIDLYRAYRKAREDAQTLAARLSDDERYFGLETSRAPSEEVSDLIQRNRNHFPALEEAAEAVGREAGLEPGNVRAPLLEHMQRAHGIEVRLVEGDGLGGAVRRYDPQTRRLLLSEVLAPEGVAFQAAHQLALVTLREPIDEVLEGETLGGEESRRLARVALANYFAGALMMPYQRFLEAADALRYDLEVLEHRFRASFEQVCHRLTTLARPGAEGIPFHLVRVDVAGNISKRFSGSGMPFARYSGACPRWNVHAAFMAPGFIRTQLSEMPDGARYFSIARTVRKAGGGFRVRQVRLAIELGCEARHASRLVYADGVNLDDPRGIVPVGVSCRLCERMDCRQRALPPMHHRLDVDENVRGLSFYYSPRSGPPEGV